MNTVAQDKDEEKLGDFLKKHPISQNFMNLLGNEHGESLFNFLPDVQFFVKDRQGRFVMGNRCLLLNYGFTEESELLGKTDKDLFPLYCAENYMRDDVLVLSGEIVFNRIELMSHLNRPDDWFITNKIPLYSPEGDIVGLAGITREYKAWQSLASSKTSMGRVIAFIKENYATNIKLSELAKIACLSESAFGKTFKKQFNMTPYHYIRTVRVSVACETLANTNVPISDIAINTGFADHSHMTREFTRQMGIPPKKYRERYFT